MIVVLVDNFDTGKPDILYAENLTLDEAQEKAKEYNDKYDDFAEYFAVIKNDTYVPYIGAAREGELFYN